MFCVKNLDIVVGDKVIDGSDTYTVNGVADYDDLNDHRPVLDWMNIIREGGIVYVGLDALSDADVASAVNGLMLQFSVDGTVDGILSDDEFTIAAGAKKTFSFQAAAKF